MLLDFELYRFEQQINEGLLTTYPADTVVKYIRKKFNLTEDDIDVDHDEYTDYIILDIKIKDIEDLYNKIEHILISSGYYFGKTEGINDEIITFERKFDEDIFSKLKESGNIKYLYHVSPSINDVKILSKGLIPHSKNYRFNYPERIYFFSDKDVLNKPYFLKEMCMQLYKTSKLGLLKKFGFDYKSRNNYEKRIKVNEYSIYKIDFSKLKDIKLYRDPNADNFEAYYTYDNIYPGFLEKIDDIKL